MMEDWFDPRDTLKMVRLVDRGAALAASFVPTANALCARMQEEFKADLAATQAVPAGGPRVITTVASSGAAKAWEGRARHRLTDERNLRDIQDDVLSEAAICVDENGTDQRLDSFLKRRFSHERYSRIWVPLVVAFDHEGRLRRGLCERCRWVRPNDSSFVRQLKACGECSIQTFGTFEIGWRRGARKITPELIRRVVAAVGRHSTGLFERTPQRVLHEFLTLAKTLGGADRASIVLGGSLADVYTTDRCLRHVRRELSPESRDIFFSDDALARPRAFDISEVRRSVGNFWSPRTLECAVFPAGQDVAVVLEYERGQALERGDELEILSRHAGSVIRNVLNSERARARQQREFLVDSVRESLTRCAGAALQGGADEMTEKAREFMSSILQLPPADLVVLHRFSGPPGQRRFERPILAGKARFEGAMHSLQNSEALERLLAPGHVFEERASANLDLLRLGADFLARERIVSCAVMRLGSAEDPVGVLFMNFRSREHFSPHMQHSLRVLMNLGMRAFAGANLTSGELLELEGALLEEESYVRESNPNDNVVPFMRVPRVAG